MILQLGSNVLRCISELDHLAAFTDKWFPLPSCTCSACSNDGLASVAKSPIWGRSPGGTNSVGPSRSSLSVAVSTYDDNKPKQ